MSELNKINFKKARSFDNERTNIWISFVFELIFVVIPFATVWILVGPFWNNDKYHNFYNQLPMKELTMILIVLTLLMIVVLINLLSYLLKIQKEDSFTYTFTIGMMLTSFVINDLWILSLLSSNNLFTWVLRFILMTVFAFIGILIGTWISILFRNNRFKIEEENEILLLAYENGEAIPSIKQIRIKRAQKYREKKVLQQIELDAFREEIDLKIERHLYENKLAKLDKKEAKKRSKKKDKN